MVAVDASYKFTYASVGTQDSVSDAGPFAHWDLRKAMDRRLLNFPPPETLANSIITVPYMFVGDKTSPWPREAMPSDTWTTVTGCSMTVSPGLWGWQEMHLAFWQTDSVFRSTICLESAKVVKITMASLCIHIFLCERRSEVYTPPAFADWKNGNHHIADGTWRTQGVGALQSVECKMERNPTLTAKMHRNLLRDYFVSDVPWQEEPI